MTACYGVSRPSFTPPAAAGAGHGRARRRLSGSSSATWPVSDMNTSSSDGRRKARARCRNTSGVQRAHHLHQYLRSLAARVHLDPTGSSTSADRWPLAQADTALDRGLPVWRRSVTENSTTSPPMRSFSLRRARRDDQAMVDHDDVVGQLVRLVHVLGGEQEGRAPRHQLTDDGPHPQPAAGVEAGGGLVEEKDPRPADQAGRQVQAPQHSAGVRLGLAAWPHRSGRNAPTVRRLDGGRSAPRWYRRPAISRFSKPVRSGVIAVA